MSKFLGCPYPISKTPHGYLPTQSDLDQIKSDLLILLLTNPGERIMEPLFGVPLREFIFEQNTDLIANGVRQAIINAINRYEPRITVSQINVSTSIDQASLNPDDDLSEINNILSVQISFFDPANIQEVQDLTLEIPLGGL